MVLNRRQVSVPARPAIRGSTRAAASRDRVRASWAVRRAIHTDTNPAWTDAHSSGNRCRRSNASATRPVAAWSVTPSTAPSSAGRELRHLRGAVPTEPDQPLRTPGVATHGRAARRAGRPSAPPAPADAPAAACTPRRVHGHLDQRRLRVQHVDPVAARASSNSTNACRPAHSSSGSGNTPGSAVLDTVVRARRSSRSSSGPQSSGSKGGTSSNGGSGSSNMCSNATTTLRQFSAPDGVVHKVERRDAPVDGTQAPSAGDCSRPVTGQVHRRRAVGA